MIAAQEIVGPTSLHLFLFTTQYRLAYSRLLGPEWVSARATSP